jgi:hypothetical protein
MILSSSEKEVQLVRDTPARRSEFAFVAPALQVPLTPGGAEERRENAERT